MPTPGGQVRDRAREEVVALPAGVYTFESFMDHDGVDLDPPVGIGMRLEVGNDMLRFDFTGTAPQVRRPWCIGIAARPNHHIDRLLGLAPLD